MLMNNDIHSVSHTLHLKRLGIDTYQEAVVYMRSGCHVCRAEGFESQSRVAIHLNGNRSIVATLNVVSEDWLPHDVAGLSEAAWRALEPIEGDMAHFSHTEPAESASLLRAKVFGQRLDVEQYTRLMRDIVDSRLSDIELAAFVTACAGDRLDVEESIGLTRAMVNVGERLTWPRAPVLDKHCIGGLPGNRTTPLVVAIVAAYGHLIPKTSSRAITSPAGTADTMAMLAPVDLDLATMQQVVERENGCIVWGGSANLSPADDILIQVERPLDFDSDGQLTASVLSKKLAAGATHVVVDIPVGPTAKIRSSAAAEALGGRMVIVGAALGLKVFLHISDGRQPVGIGIGPALEARDVLAVLQNRPDAPADLRARALDLAGAVLELAPTTKPGTGRMMATSALADGRAWHKFQAICEAQGGMREPPFAAHRHVLVAQRNGIVSAFDNRRISRLAKLAGAPRTPAAGLECHIRLDQQITSGEPLLTVHAESAGELAYALAYYTQHADMIIIGDPA